MQKIFQDHSDILSKVLFHMFKTIGNNIPKCLRRNRKVFSSFLKKLKVYVDLLNQRKDKSNKQGSMLRKKAEPKKLYRSLASQTFYSENGSWFDVAMHGKENDTIADDTYNTQYVPEWIVTHLLCENLKICKTKKDACKNGKDDALKVSGLDTQYISGSCQEYCVLQ